MANERISDVIERWVALSPEHPALVEGGSLWTYHQLSEAIGETEAWLRNYGVRPGDRVVLVCDNCREFIALLLALTRLDAWAVLVNARLSAPELDQIRDHCGARCCLYTTRVSPQARAHANRHNAQVVDLPNVGKFESSAVDEAAVPEAIGDQPSERVGALIYTSGTTGRPKGVMLTHANLLFLAAGSAEIRSLTPQDRMFGILPMSHAVGLSVVLLGSLLSGATLYLTTRFDPAAALRLLEEGQITVMLGAPSMYALFLEYTKLKGIESLRCPKLRIIASASAPLQIELKAAVERLFGMTLHNGYGVTECSPTIAQTRIESPRSDISIGPAFPGVEIKLVDADGCSIADGEIGELWVRGPNVMKGYYRAPEETAAAISADGWFNTHDLARFEGENLFIVGRSKELIVRFGLNVYPGEVESVLNNHPAIARSAVIGQSVAGSAGDEEVVAFVEFLPGNSVNTDELAGYASTHLAPYKRPSRIVVVARMPTTPTGKIMKGELVRSAESSVAVC